MVLSLGVSSFSLKSLLEVFFWRTVLKIVRAFASVAANVVVMGSTHCLCFHIYLHCYSVAIYWQEQASHVLTGVHHKPPEVLQSSPVAHIWTNQHQFSKS